MKKTRKEFSATAQTPDDLSAIAQEILEACVSRKIFAFYGTLGAGKTALIRELCKLSGVTDDLSSPTFAIVNEYTGERTVYHIDLYRLEKQQEALEIGIMEYLESGELCFVEWPQLISDWLPDDSVTVDIDVATDQSRNIKVAY